MPKSMIGVKEVAAALHVSVREVIRLADDKILPGRRVRGEWEFRAGEIWNWIEANLQSLPERRERDRHPTPPSTLLITPTIKLAAIKVDLHAKTKSSVLRELAGLASTADQSLDESSLIAALTAREAAGSTALQDGVAIPHPASPQYSEGPVVAAARTSEGVIFGERGGGLTDLFFLICCPRQVDHLLYLGRLCRLLIDRQLQITLRDASNEDAFADAIIAAESRLCRSV
ncbi:MAG: PTS sugar transporter subunit IIA [Planctomycetes bacterium]|nr:PTS sugar transporter subunit IIA [Planctomycetota bacterium]